MGLFGKKKENAELPMQMPPPMPGEQMPVPGEQMPPPMQQVPPSQPFAMNPPEMSGQPGLPPPQSDQFQQPYQAPQQPFEPRMSTEETVEAIIDEKWNDLLKDINKLVQWKERTDLTLNKLQQEVDDIKDNVDSLHKSITSKISTYDENIKNVGVDIKAMEQVFQRILPKFTDNVNKLSRITDKVSKK